jgi:uncharacterized protein (DUF427 family)
MTGGHTITITPSTAHVEVWLGGEKIADSHRPVLLDETGLPTRYYLPREDVRAEVLRETDSATTCPFKGQARYWSVELDGRVFHDIVWSYEHPIPKAEGITGLLCFYNERVDVSIDGERLPRPETPVAR